VAPAAATAALVECAKEGPLGRAAGTLADWRATVQSKERGPCIEGTGPADLEPVPLALFAASKQQQHGVSRSGKQHWRQ